MWPLLTNRWICFETQDWMHSWPFTIGWLINRRDTLKCTTNRYIVPLANPSVVPNRTSLNWVCNVAMLLFHYEHLQTYSKLY